MDTSAIAPCFSPLSSRRPAKRGDLLSTRRRAPITGKFKGGDTRWSSDYSRQRPGLASYTIEEGRLGIRRVGAPGSYRMVAWIFAGRPCIRRRSPGYSWTTGQGRGLSTRRMPIPGPPLRRQEASNGHSPLLCCREREGAAFGWGRRGRQKVSNRRETDGAAARAWGVMPRPSVAGGTRRRDRWRRP